MDIDVSIHGPYWYTMQYSGDKNGTLYLTPNISSEVYILKDSAGDPNNFVYDMSFKTVNGNTTFSSADLGLNQGQGFSVAVYFPAIDEPNNKLLHASMNVVFSEGGATWFSFAALTSTFLVLGAAFF